MTRNFKAGDVVQHFKRETVDNPTSQYLYTIVGEATHTETGEKLMVYQALYDSKDGAVTKFQMFARPLDMFMGEVDRTKYPDIKQKYRFEKYNK